MPATPPPAPLRLRIEPFVESAQGLAQRVRSDLPTHQGLARAADAVAAAAVQAERVTCAMRRWYSPHRLPPVFLAAALLCLGGWIYWRFIHVSTLTLAMPDRDATLLRERVAGRGRVSFRSVEMPGSRESLEAVDRGAVDLAFVQGGFAIPADLPQLETPSPEVVLWLVRKELAASGKRPLRILTSSAGEGSHTVAQKFLDIWLTAQQRHGVQFVHDWRKAARDATYQIPADIEAVFVVKDPADPETLTALERLATAGFVFQSPELGLRAERSGYLQHASIARGYLQAREPVLPSEAFETYHVATYLVARRGLTPRLLGQAAEVLEAGPATISEGKFNPSTADASEIFQGVDAFLGIIVNIGLAFLALLGLDAMTYRKQFHELNSLVSLLSMLQSNKDVLGLTVPKQRAENLLYLGLVSDLLGLISMISSYYTQENSALLFNNLSEVIHQRCNGLKINIQLKILHATVQMPEAPQAKPGDSAAAPTGDAREEAP